ncbi:two-component sensor histidine kinase [Photobacterium japonica]|uniref:sensor histidine kinase n=1 Tax=Photobacterium japonica TaxID=2910235 RepID=UPI003D1159F2
MNKAFMKVKSAKQLTFTYFAIIAFGIVTLHFSLLDATLENFEQINAKNRLNYAKGIAEQSLTSTPQDHFAIPPFSHAYLDKALLPNDLVLPEDLPQDKAIELFNEESGVTDHFLMHTQVTVAGKTVPLYLIYFDDIYEISEEEIFYNQAKQLFISLILLVISLMVVLKVSSRLTDPITQLANDIEQRKTDDLSPIVAPKGIASRELLQLVDSFNEYHQRIQALIDRERAFNRYASHELRTPLMVIKGAISLLGQSNEPAFIDKQRQRLLHASNEMNDFVTTLLSLTREDDLETLTERPLVYDEVADIMHAHAHLLAHKDVSWDVDIASPIAMKMPAPTFNILLGNLVKNAFACTEQGSVTVTVNAHTIQVQDTGMGLGSKPRGVEGYGLGLLIANDICRKYQWQLTLANTNAGGCCATIMLGQSGTPTDQPA